MSVEEASEEFCTIIEKVYKRDDISPSERTNELRRCMEDVMRKKGLPLDMKLMDKTRESGCPW